MTSALPKDGGETCEHFRQCTHDTTQHHHQYLSPQERSLESSEAVATPVLHFCTSSQYLYFCTRKSHQYLSPQERGLERSEAVLVEVSQRLGNLLASNAISAVASVFVLLY